MLRRRSFLLLPALGLLPYRRMQSGLVMPPSLPPVNRLAFGGDVMMCRYVGERARALADPGAPMRDIAPFFSSADIAFVNLEAPFSDRGRPIHQGMVFKVEPEMVEALRIAGIGIVSTANNHARDCGSYGVSFTLDWLARNGIAAVGSGETAEAAHNGVVLERNGVKFGFLAYTYDQSNGNFHDRDDRIATMDIHVMAADVARMLERADVAIVSMHAGIEYWSRPNQQQREFAHAAIDAGAQLVVGHHPHVVEPAESYRHGVIFYSLGNLVFDQFQRKDTQHGLVADVIFVGKRLAHWKLLPVDIVRAAPRLASTTDENGVSPIGGRNVRSVSGGSLASAR